MLHVSSCFLDMQNTVFVMTLIVFVYKGLALVCFPPSLWVVCSSLPGHLFDARRELYLSGCWIYSYTLVDAGYILFFFFF